MRIDKLHLQDFGQFHNKDISLAPGVNVIYGANEAGKTTIKDFIVDMFYGIEKSRGTAAHFDHYEQKKPIQGYAFSGAMEIATGESEYLIERNFSRSEKKTTVKDLNTGREIALNEPNDLQGTVLNTDKNTYMNTLCIGHMGAATDKEIAGRLSNYIVNMASSKTGDVDAVNAIVALKNKKKEFSNKQLEQEEQELTQKLTLERDFDGELAAIKEEYAKVEQSMQGEKAESLQFSPINGQQNKKEESAEEQEEVFLTKKEMEIQMLRNMGRRGILDNPFIVLFLAVLGIAVFVVLASAIPLNDPQIKIGIMGFGTAWMILAVLMIFVKRAKLYRLLEEIEIEQGFEDAKNLQTDDAQVQRQYVEQLSNLKVREERIISERSQQEQYLKEIQAIKEKKAENAKELAALDLAIETMQKLSEEIYDSFGSVLNEKVSKIVSKITNQKYTEVKIDDQLHVMVRKDNSFMSMEYLSAGTIEQIYLALRLAIADVLMTEDMPIVIDDIFVGYDEHRLYETLSCLGGYMKHQIILFTTNSSIKDMLHDMGVAYNYIAM